MIKKILKYITPKSFVQRIIKNFIMIDGLIVLSSLIWGTFDKGIEPIGNLGAIVLIIVGQGLLILVCLVIFLINILYNFFNKKPVSYEFSAFSILAVTLVAIFFLPFYAYLISSIVLSILYNQNRIKTDEEQKYDRNF